MIHMTLLKKGLNFFSLVILVSRFALAYTTETSKKNLIATTVEVCCSMLIKIMFGAVLYIRRGDRWVIGLEDFIHSK